MSEFQFHPSQLELSNDAQSQMEDDESVEVKNHLDFSAFNQPYSNEPIGACNQPSSPYELCNDAKRNLVNHESEASENDQDI